MFIDLKQEGERFEFFNSTVNPNTGDIDYDDPVKNGPWMTLRPPGPFWEKRLKTRKKKVEHVLNPKTRQMERISYYPELPADEDQAEREDLWDYCIVDFGGFKDPATKADIKPTKKNKVAMVRVPVIDRFVSRCFQIMAEAKVEQQEKETGN